MSDTIHVLDAGFVRLVDHMGDDERIVESARISTNQAAKSPEEDARLIDYLMRNAHTSPFEQVLFTFHIKCPIFVARQWLRHRTARVNEISGRYVEMAAEFHVPEMLRKQSKSNHQASVDSSVENEPALLERMKEEQQAITGNYESYLEAGVARELARINLPLSVYTQFYWNMDLHNLFHFLRLRLHHHAQREIRVYAEAIASLIKPLVPMAYAAWEEHQRLGVHLSAAERAAVEELLKLPGADQVLAKNLDERAQRIFLREKLMIKEP